VQSANNDITEKEKSIRNFVGFEAPFQIAGLRVFAQVAPLFPFSSAVLDI